MDGEIPLHDPLLNQDDKKMEQGTVSEYNEAFDYWCNILGRPKVLDQNTFDEYKNLFIDNGMWIDDIKELGRYLRSGYESDVYVSYADPSMVLKVKLQQYTKTLVGTLISAKYHNLLFPETCYSLIGFTAKKNNIYVVLGQNRVRGTTVGVKRVCAYFEQRGYTVYELGAAVSKDGLLAFGITGTDAVEHDGNIYVMDCYVYML